MVFRIVLVAVVTVVLAAVFIVGYSVGINDGFARATLSETSMHAGTLLGVRNESALAEGERRKRLSLHIAAEVKTFAESCPHDVDIASMVMPSRTQASDFLVQRIIRDREVSPYIDQYTRIFLRHCGFSLD